MNAKQINRKATKHAEAIARNVLGLETIETRNSDSLDFHDLAIGSIRDALIAAYKAGVADGKSTAAPTLQAIKTLWDKHGLGDNDDESTPVYDALVAALASAEGRNI